MIVAGTPVQKASYAFPEVRNLVVSIIREATETFDVDGVNLCFIRSPEFMAYEQPVLDDFRKEYGEDGRKVGFDDPRMRTIRCRYLNTFVLQEGRDIKRQTGIRLAALVAALLTSSCKCSWPKRFQHYPRDFLG